MTRPTLHRGAYDRAELGTLLNSEDLVGEAVEIGVFRGEFSEAFLNKWKGRTLYCVDPWLPTEYYPGDRENDLLLTKRALNRHHYGRWKALRVTSEAAARRVPDGALDFVYLDGDHNYASVKQDLSLWWPKLRPGGLMAGHDWLCPVTHDAGWGRFVQPAVLEFCELNGIAAVYQVCELDNSPWSFYFWKHA
jgi:hypothetical protein